MGTPVGMTLVRTVLSRGDRSPLFHYVDLDRAMRTRSLRVITLCGALAVDEAMDPRTPHRLCARCKRASQGDSEPTSIELLLGDDPHCGAVKGVDSRPHPASFSDAVLDWIIDDLAARVMHKPWCLDPFAGIGKGVDRLNAAGYDAIGVELEPEWACWSPRVRVADALELPWNTGLFDVIVTSPCYGNRMADAHDAKDASERRTYKHTLGRDPAIGSAAVMRWGPAYREFHRRAWREVIRMMRPPRDRQLGSDGAWFYLNISDHVRGKERQFVADWHLAVLLNAGLSLVRAVDVVTPRMGFGENRDLRVEAEQVFVFQLRRFDIHGRLL